MGRLFSFLKKGAEEQPRLPVRILVIDDENNIRLTVQMALEHVGHHVETAADGPEGLAKFAAGPPWDVVLLDHRMPGMEGLEVLREIRRRAPEARIIMITAFGTIDLAVEAMKAGATDFLRKPFTAEALRGAIRAALQRPSAADTPDSSLSAFPEDAPALPFTFGMTTINGFRIESYPGSGVRAAGDLVHTFGVKSPDGETRQYGVRLPAYVVELVKAYTDRETLPGGDRFWQALSEEALANYVWQHDGFPPDATLDVDDLTAGLRRWIDAVLGAVV